MGTRLEHNGKTVLATGAGKASLGATTLLFKANETGEWILHVRFEDGDDVMTEASFPFMVEHDAQWTAYSEWVTGVLSFLGGMFGVMLFIRLRGKGATE